MATQTLEFTAATGLTIICKIFAVGSDTLVDSATATEKTNDKNRYSVSYTDIPAGTYRLNGFVSDIGGFANEIYDLTLTTGTFYPRSEQEVSSTPPDVIVNVTPSVVIQPDDDAINRNLTLYTNESDTYSFNLFENDLITPVDLSGITPEFRVSDLNDELLYTIGVADIDITGTDNNTISFPKTSLTLDDFKGKWGLRDTANGDKVVAYGRIEVIYVP